MRSVGSFSSATLFLSAGNAVRQNRIRAMSARQKGRSHLKTEDVQCHQGMSLLPRSNMAARTTMTGKLDGLLSSWDSGPFATQIILVFSRKFWPEEVWDVVCTDCFVPEFWMTEYPVRCTSTLNGKSESSANASWAKSPDTC